MLRFPEYVPYKDEKRAPDGGSDDQLMLVHKSLRVLERGIVCAHHDVRGLGQWVIIEHHNTPLTLINFHGTPFPGEKYDNPERLAASAEIIACAREHTPAIVMGDFNLRETTKSITLFSENGFRNLIAEYNIPTTRNHHIWDLYPDNKIMHSDYVFVREGVQVDHFEVLPDIVSDHQPLVLEIR